MTISCHAAWENWCVRARAVVQDSHGHMENFPPTRFSRRFYFIFFVNLFFIFFIFFFWLTLILWSRKKKKKFILLFKLILWIIRFNSSWHLADTRGFLAIYLNSRSAISPSRTGIISPSDLWVLSSLTSVPPGFKSILIELARFTATSHHNFFP